MPPQSAFFLVVLGLQLASAKLVIKNDIRVGVPVSLFLRSSRGDTELGDLWDGHEAEVYLEGFRGERLQIVAKMDCPVEHLDMLTGEMVYSTAKLRAHKKFSVPPTGPISTRLLTLGFDEPRLAITVSLSSLQELCGAEQRFKEAAEEIVMREGFMRLLEQPGGRLEALETLQALAAEGHGDANALLAMLGLTMLFFNPSSRRYDSFPEMMLQSEDTHLWNPAIPSTIDGIVTLLDDAIDQGSLAASLCRAFLIHSKLVEGKCIDAISYAEYTVEEFMARERLGVSLVYHDDGHEAHDGDDGDDGDASGSHKYQSPVEEDVLPAPVSAIPLETLTLPKLKMAVGIPRGLDQDQHSPRKAAAGKAGGAGSKDENGSVFQQAWQRISSALGFNADTGNLDDELEYHRMQVESSFGGDSAEIAESAFILGESFAYGFDVPQDYQEAIRYLEIASRHGQSEADELLGFIYYGMAATEDPARASPLQGTSEYAKKARAYLKLAGSGRANSLLGTSELDALEDEASEYAWENRDAYRRAVQDRALRGISLLKMANEMEDPFASLKLGELLISYGGAIEGTPEDVSPEMDWRTVVAADVLTENLEPLKVGHGDAFTDGQRSAAMFYLNRAIAVGKRDGYYEVVGDAMYHLATLVLIPIEDELINEELEQGDYAGMDEPLFDGDMIEMTVGEDGQISEISADRPRRQPTSKAQDDSETARVDRACSEALSFLFEAAVMAIPRWKTPLRCREESCADEPDCTIDNSFWADLDPSPAFYDWITTQHANQDKFHVGSSNLVSRYSFLSLFGVGFAQLNTAHLVDKNGLESSSPLFSWPDKRRHQISRRYAAMAARMQHPEAWLHLGNCALQGWEGECTEGAKPSLKDYLSGGATSNDAFRCEKCVATGVGRLMEAARLGDSEAQRQAAQTLGFGFRPGEGGDAEAPAERIYMDRKLARTYYELCSSAGYPFNVPCLVEYPFAVAFWAIDDALALTMNFRLCEMTWPRLPFCTS